MESQYGRGRFAGRLENFILFFSLQVLRLCATLWVMTDYRYLYVHALAWLYALLFCPFVLTQWGTTAG